MNPHVAAPPNVNGAPLNTAVHACRRADRADAARPFAGVALLIGPERDVRALLG